MTETMKRILELRKKGRSCREIAAECGCSFQYAAQVISQKDCPFKGIDERRCIYRGLREWMNGTETGFAELGKRVYGGKAADKKTALYRKLNGGVELKLHEINRLIDITGRSYEELFR